MGKREVSDKELKNIAKALKCSVDDLKKDIKVLDDKGMLEEIIQRNDAKYKLLSNPRGAIASFGSNSSDTSKISVYGTASKDGSIIIYMDEEIKKVFRPSQLNNKKDAYAVNLCTRSLGSLLPTRSILFINPQEVISVGDLALYYKSETYALAVSIREDDTGMLYATKCNPEEKIELNTNDLQKVHEVVFISL